jgi:small basic protein (TIGR04137 family)
MFFLATSFRAGVDPNLCHARTRPPPIKVDLINQAHAVTSSLALRFNLVTILPYPMSQHRSLKGASTITAKRNVLKRFERVELLKKRGQWKEGSKVIGLPKTKPDA